MRGLRTNVGFWKAGSSQKQRANHSVGREFTVLAKTKCWPKPNEPSLCGIVCIQAARRTTPLFYDALRLTIACMDCAHYNQSLYSQYRLADIFYRWRNEHHAEWSRKCHNSHVCSTWPSSLGCEYLLAAYNKSSKIDTLAKLIDKRTGTPTSG